METKKTTYNTYAEAYNDGLVRAREIGGKFRVGDYRLRLVDCSRKSECGYEFRLDLEFHTNEEFIDWTKIKTIARSKKIWFRKEKNQMNDFGCMAIMFDYFEVEQKFNNHPLIKSEKIKLSLEKETGRRNREIKYAKITDSKPELFMWLVDGKNFSNIPDSVVKEKRESGLSWKNFIDREIN
jgi:hypothetical protein